MVEEVEEVDAVESAEPVRETSKTADRTAPAGEETTGAGSAGAGSGEGTKLSKQERKRLKKQRQKEEKQRRAKPNQSNEPAEAKGTAQSASAGDDDIDDIFGVRKQSDPDDVGPVPIFAEGDGDGYVSDGEGGVVARDMEDLEQIFAERRAKVGSARVAAAAAANKDAAEERDAYVTGKGGKSRRLIDGLSVYTEDEVQKTALSDVKGTLDGPCPFECSCCF